MRHAPSLTTAASRVGLRKCGRDSKFAYRDQPFIAYGTDWLAFGHIIIAMFFIGPWVRPRGNEWVLKVGIVACALVFPLALVCGPLRGIPFYWRLIDCSFGLLGAIPLLYCLRISKRIRQ